MCAWQSMAVDIKLIFDHVLEHASKATVLLFVSEYSTVTVNSENQLTIKTDETRRIVTQNGILIVTQIRAHPETRIKLEVGVRQRRK